MSCGTTSDFLIYMSLDGKRSSEKNIWRLYGSNFSKFDENHKLRNPGIPQMTNKRNMKKTVSCHFLIKVFKTDEKEKIFKASKEKEKHN